MNCYLYTKYLKDWTNKMFYCKQCNSLIFERNSDVIKCHLEHNPCKDYGILAGHIYDKVASIFIRNGSKDMLNLNNLTAEELLDVHNILKDTECCITRRSIF